MQITYSDGITPVKLGDNIQRRNWFWLQKGTVVYIPGISDFNENMEYGGLRWVGIQLHKGAFVATVVDPDKTALKKSIVFIDRSKAAFKELDASTDPFAADDTLNV